jgi:hypothetical protein
MLNAYMVLILPCEVGTISILSVMKLKLKDFR